MVKMKLDQSTPLMGYREDFFNVSLSELSGGEICSLAIVSPEDEQMLEATFDAIFDVSLPQPGKISNFEGGYIFWTAPHQWFLVHSEMDDCFYDRKLQGQFNDKMAITLQSDGWARMKIEGPNCRKVLEKFIMLDLDDSVFPVGCAARTLAGHLNIFILRHGGSNDVYEIWCARSFASSLMETLKTAARNIG